MPTLYLVRHGQASFGAADYDVLSALGHRQCRALGEWFGARGVAFDSALCGSLRRHAESYAAIAEGHGALPAPSIWPQLDEYDGAAVVGAVHAEPLAQGDGAAAYKRHFCLLREGLLAWMEGRTAPRGMPRYADWVAGIDAVLDHVRTHGRGNVLVVSSGGPIATAIGRVLAAPSTTTIELNLQLRNSALTQLHYTARRLVLVTYNHVPHLEAVPDRGHWVTYA